MPAPAGLVQQFDQYLHRHPLLPPGCRILVACSGGADSVALLRLLQSVNQSCHWRWRLGVGHVNHALRGSRSDSDERFVRRLAERLGLPVQVRRLTWPGRGGRGRRVSEQAARMARLAALRAMARQGRYGCVALAHQADDQAETVILRLLRGAGPRGLGGMAPRRHMRGMVWVRPLLPWRRAVLRCWLTDLGQPWREDLTNTDRRFLRNRVRHELLPLLRHYQPNLPAVLGRVALNQRSVYRALARQAALVWRQARPHRRDGCLRLAREPLAHAARAVTMLALRRALRWGGSGGDRINHPSLDQLVTRLRDRRWRGVMQFAGPVTVHVHGQDVTVRSGV